VGHPNFTPFGEDKYQVSSGCGKRPKLAISKRKVEQGLNRLRKNSWSEAFGQGKFGRG
jgi:hypothetical protein